MHLDGSFVHALLDAGADIEARTTMGLTALHLAAQHHNLAAITVLLENGANQRVEDARFNRTPLLFAVDRSTGVIVSKFYRYAVPASNEGFDVISALTENGSDVNARDVSGATPLNLAVIHCGTPDLRLLLDAGADPNAQNVAGDTPLYNAIVYENEAARRILLEYGADEDVVDLEGIKVVEKAVAYGPVLRAFFAQTSEINRDQNLSAAQRAERTAEAVRAMKLTLEERHQTLLSSR
jgi:ankyrin repeat protein